MYQVLQRKRIFSVTSLLLNAHLSLTAVSYLLVNLLRPNSVNFEKDDPFEIITSLLYTRLIIMMTILQECWKIWFCGNWNFINYLQKLYWLWNISRYLEEASYHTSSNKKSLNNYLSVALSIYGKIFKRIITNAVFLFLEKNHWLNLY